MGDWRHSGDRPGLHDGAALAGALPAAGLQARLAGVIEGEILPRLMLVHRTAPARPGPARRPGPDEVARFCRLLLAREMGDVTPHVLALLDRGLPLETLLLDLLTPAARHLGVLWEEDACDFVEVTLAIGRLQAVTRGLCSRLEADEPDSGRSILLAPCPGETHLFGLSMVASFFREAGWRVVSAGTESDPCDLARHEWFDVIGLSLSGEVLVPAMTQAVRALRAASRNRAVRVLVGGPHFARVPGDVARVGADATAADGRAAPTVAENLLERRARAC